MRIVLDENLPRSPEDPLVESHCYRGDVMATVEAITTAIAELPPEQVAQVRAWMDERAEAEWDAQIERDERAGRLDTLAERALAEHRAGQTRPL